MSYCSRHGIEHPSGRTCPECQIEREEEQHEEVVSALSELRNVGDVSTELVSIRAAIAALQSKLLNPGEYQCPHCGRVALEYEASVCPICHRDIDDEFWDAIDEAAEARKQEKEEEERRRKAAEAEAKRVAEWQEFEREVAVEVKRMRRWEWWTGVYSLDLALEARARVERRRRRR